MNHPLLAAGAVLVDRPPVVDVLSAVLIFAGVAFAVLAGIGMLRFRDVLGRMHAATKPATLGLMLVVAGVALQLPASESPVLVLVIVFQLLTAPVAAHMVGRAAYRNRAYRADLLEDDELAPVADRLDGSQTDGSQTVGRETDGSEA